MPQRDRGARAADARLSQDPAAARSPRSQHAHDVHAHRPHTSGEIPRGVGRIPGGRTRIRRGLLHHRRVRAPRTTRRRDARRGRRCGAGDRRAGRTELRNVDRRRGRHRPPQRRRSPARTTICRSSSTPGRPSSAATESSPMPNRLSGSVASASAGCAMGPCRFTATSCPKRPPVCSSCSMRTTAHPRASARRRARPATTDPIPNAISTTRAQRRSDATTSSSR